MFRSVPRVGDAGGRGGGGQFAGDSMCVALLILEEMQQPSMLCACSVHTQNCGNRR